MIGRRPIGGTWSWFFVTFHNHYFPERLGEPRRRVSGPQSRCVMASITQQAFKRHEALPESEANAKAQACLVRTAKYPAIIRSTYRVRPKRLFTGIEKGKHRFANDRGSFFGVTDFVNCGQRLLQGR